MLEEVQGQSEGLLYLRKVIHNDLRVPLLLIGPDGVGKRFSVLEAAKELVKDDENQVYQINQGVHPDIKMVSPEAQGKDIKVDAIRGLLKDANFKPSRAPFKILVVDGIDTITPAAANALLKVLEEAPDSIRFILLAEDETKILPTILSRVAPVRYRGLSEDFVSGVLLNHTEDATRALVCSRLAEGSVGRAVRYLGSGKLSLRDTMFDLLVAGQRKDRVSLFSAVDGVKDLPLGLIFFEHILHDLLMLSHTPSRITNLDKTSELAQMKKAMGDEKVERLRTGLRTVQKRSRGPINQSFHVKTLLASAFS